ncbi:retention module-containing protein, partial [Photobacterium carnosum]|uniref:retention module-containing protein n=1 Tax=Photobacterium carnosum TaxID=2023717 RepID=UPI00242D04FB
MVKIENNNNELKLIDGTCFVIKNNKNILAINHHYQLQSDEIIIANSSTKMIFKKDGIEQVIDQPVSTCSMLSADGLKIVSLKHGIDFNHNGIKNTPFSDNDISAIQNAILTGQDPTKLFEATAAGDVGLNGSSATASFITINYDNDSMLAKAGFDTAYEPHHSIQPIDPNVILTTTADGGELRIMTVVEGDLSPLAGEQGYPVQSAISIVVEAATLPLETSSFVFDPLTINNVLNELNSEITSGGQAVTFVYDKATNAIVGRLEGQPVLSIALEATSDNGRDVTVTVTTTIIQPIDHSGGNISGLVARDGDQINIDVAIQATDINGNALDKPINVKVEIEDGEIPTFSIPTELTFNEEQLSDQVSIVQDGKMALDVGSDNIKTLVVQSITIDHSTTHVGEIVDGLTSNGHTVKVTATKDGVALIDQVTHQTVLTLDVDPQGQYKTTLYQPIDEKTLDKTLGKLTITANVVATDFDGDSAQGAINITVNDATTLPSGGDIEDANITITEGDLTPSTGEQGYPVSGNTTIVIEARADRLDPSKVTIDPTLIGELESELTTGNNEAISFHYDAVTGVLIGNTAAGEQVVTVSLNAVQAANGHDIDVKVTITQEKPLNHTDSGVDGLVDSINDKITIKVPIQVQDTDGDCLQKHVDIIIKDGANPVFGIDSGTTIT